MTERDIDMFKEGACIYELGHRGDIIETAAWARNDLVANAAFREICRRNPERNYEVRRGAWVQGCYQAPDYLGRLRMTMALPEAIVLTIRDIEKATNMPIDRLVGELLEAGIANYCVQPCGAGMINR
jgi:hypothetical protein